MQRPSRAVPHIAIVGAGLAGACAAWALRMRGARVSVFEAEHVAAGASGAAAGMLQPLIGMRLTYHAQNVQDFERSRALIAQLLLEGTHWRASGVLRLVKNPKQVAQWQRRMQEIPESLATWKNADALRALEPRLQPAFRAGVWIPDACMVDVPAFVRALLQVAEAEIHEFTRLSALEESPTGVTLWDESTKIESRFDAVVIASGAQAPQPIADPEIRMQPYLGIMATYKGLEPPPIALNYRGYITAWHDGSVLVGTVDRREGFDAEPTQQSLEELHARLQSVLVLNTPPERMNVWKGLRPALPDRAPVAQSASGYDRVWIFTGFGGRGLMVGPRMAEALAAEILPPRSKMAQ